LIEQKRIAATDRVTHAEREMAWTRENWFSLPVYLKLNGKPVLLSFGYSGLSDGEWEQVLRSLPSRPLYLSEHRRRPGADGSFDWPQPQTGLPSVDAYYQTPKGDSVLMPVAFPRFHDIYKEAKVHDSYGEIPDDGGRTLTTTLERALKSGAPLVQIATWNDWGEGTGIEPTKEYGYRDLETISRLTRPASASTGRSTDDLRLPYRLWVLRGRQVETPSRKAENDSVASMISSGRTSAARTELTRLESVIH
jgi:Glycosyltransferase WbsX